MREQLRVHYSHSGRPSIDPELIVRMLVIGYTLGIRSERRLCDEVHLNLAYRRFCRLGLDGKVPDHRTFSKYRHGKFRDSNLLRAVFEAVVARCISEGLVGGHGFAVDASLIEAEVARQNSGVQADWDVSELDPDDVPHAVRKTLDVSDDNAFGAPPPSHPNSRLIPTRPANGPQPAKGQQYSHTQTITSSTPTIPLSWTSRRHDYPHV